MPDAARVDDNHDCPCPTPQAHVGGPIDSPASENVETNTKGAARATDKLTCTPVALKNYIVTGSTTVEINGKLAARKTDFTMHPGPGTIAEGSPNVEIGGATGGATLGNPDAGGQMCRDAANGRTSGRTQQSYQNCGIESTRQIINQATGGNVTEDALFDEAIANGDAHRATTGKWPFREFDRANSGGTWDWSWPNIAGRHGVGMHNETQNIQNLTQAIADGKGIVTAHDAGQLWGDPNVNGGHAIVPTGVEYDENGQPKNIIYNDTGTGQCQTSLPVDQFTGSFLGGFNMGVTDNPIFP